MHRINASNRRHLVAALISWGMLWSVASAVAATSHPTSSTDLPASAYEHAQTLIALPDGRHLNLFCMGTGSPVVIFEAGGGDDSLSFRRVQGRLAAVTRVCSYDRAGMGFSDPSDGPSTAFHTVNDLHELIRQAVMPLPVVLVGHSDGGLYVAFYAAEFPKEVAGLVLIDPDSFGLDESATKVLDQPWLNQWRAGIRSDIRQVRTCHALAKSGALARMPERYPDCMDNPPNADSALHRLLNAQLARPSEQETVMTERLDTDPSPGRDLSNAELAFQHLHFDFGDKPIVVLSGTIELGALPPSQQAKVNRAILANQAAMAAYSTQGRQILVDSTSEYLQTYCPDVVVHAVTDVVRKVRTRAAMPQAGRDAQRK